MKIAAVICEYNPFHNGHKYQIDAARSMLNCDGFIGLMSGSFVQRGEFAVFETQVRAQAAIVGGIDLVLENPAVSVLCSAEKYADSAVYLLDSLGCTDYLVFGAETSDLKKLKKIAAFFADESPLFKSTLSNELKSGKSYAAARSDAVKTILGEDLSKELSLPNNLLAIEYLKALIRRKSSIEPILIERSGAMHDSDDTEGCSASASKIREMLMKNEDISRFVPTKAAEIYRSAAVFNPKASDAAILSSICLSSKEQLAAVPDISEGLENKIKREAITAESLSELISAVKSKRYAYSRIRRALLCSYLGIKDNTPLLSYVKILDFNTTGQKIISLAKKTSSIVIAKNASAVLKDEKALNMWKKQLEFDRVYEIMSQTII